MMIVNNGPGRILEEAVLPRFTQRVYTILSHSEGTWLESPPITVYSYDARGFLQ
jgi:hypothetical protein